MGNVKSLEGGMVRGRWEGICLFTVRACVCELTAGRSGGGGGVFGPGRSPRQPTLVGGRRDVA